MLVEAEEPEGADSEEGGDGPAAAGEGGFALADLRVDEAEEERGEQGEEKQEEEDGLKDEDEGAGVPMGVEGEEGAETVVVGPVEEEVREQGQEGEGEEERPSWAGLWFAACGGGGRARSRR